MEWLVAATRCLAAPLTLQRRAERSAAAAAVTKPSSKRGSSRPLTPRDKIHAMQGLSLMDHTHPGFTLSIEQVYANLSFLVWAGSFHKKTHAGQQAEIQTFAQKFQSRGLLLPHLTTNDVDSSRVSL
ncbi:hypothetical protein MN608_08593 [Microdochium nivale]|nr:hypothetical protein MN608_08593 [Microdochium nivale]